MWRVMIWYCAIVSISAYSYPVTMTLVPTRLFKGPVNVLAFAGMKNGCVVMQYVYCEDKRTFLSSSALLFWLDFSEKVWLPQLLRKVMANNWCCAGGFPAKNVLWPLVLHENGVRRVRVEGCIVRQASGDRASTVSTTLKTITEHHSPTHMSRIQCEWFLNIPSRLAA